MTIRGYQIISGCFFFLIAGLHLIRLIYQMPVQVGDWIVPVWISVGGVVVPGALSVVAFKLLGKLNGSKKM